MNKTRVFTPILLAASFVLVFAPLWKMDNNLNSIVSMLLGVAFVLVHGSTAMGWRNALAFLAITVVVSFTAEAAGVATGLVFGPYHYTDLLGPKILGVPVMIQIAYAAMGYSCLMTTRVLLGLAGQAKKRAPFLAALIGAFVMTAWDVALDPYQSTLGGQWLWHTGGPYFGIGIHNFVGWFATVFAFMFVYQLYESRFPEPAVEQPPSFWSQPVIYYVIMALNIILVPLTGGISSTYASPQNYSGSLASVIWSMSLVAFFAMGTPAVLALARLWTDDRRVQGA
jgi:putative membrane protein